MQTRSSDENSVRLSVRPSDKRVICDKMEERSVQIFISYVRLSVTRVHCDKTVESFFQIYIPYERTFIPVF